MQNSKRTLMLSALFVTLAVIAGIVWYNDMHPPAVSSKGSYYYKGPKRAKSGAPYYVTEEGRIVQPGQEGTPLITDGKRAPAGEPN